MVTYYLSQHRLCNMGVTIQPLYLSILTQQKFTFCLCYMSKMIWQGPVLPVAQELRVIRTCARVAASFGT